MPRRATRSAPRTATRAAMLTAALVAPLALAACSANDVLSTRHLEPVPKRLQRAMAKKDMAVEAPVLMRIFKEEAR